MMKKLMMIGLVTLPLLGGCATKMQTGTAIGALTGGALAYGLGKDSGNKELWTVLGIGLGGMVGSNIGQQLDERDRMLMGQTFNHTMEKAPINATGQWQNPDTGHGGSVTPTRTFETETGTLVVSLHKQLVSVGRWKKPMGLRVAKPMVHGRLSNAYIRYERS